jgi:hypothetical protein
MTNRKNNKPRQPRKKEDKELQAIYDRVRREFSAADLQKYTEIEETVPLDQVIARMEAIHRKITEKKKRT